MCHRIMRLSRARVLVLDAETTGLDPANDRIVELAGAYLDAGAPAGIHQIRVNPGVPIPPEASSVHGIWDADVAEAPSFAEVAPRLLTHLDGTAARGMAPVLAGYNLRRFDIPLLNAELARAGLSARIDRDAVLDLMIFVRWHHRDLRRRTLGAMVAHYGVELLHAHTAAGDASATALLLLRMLEAGRIPDDLDAALAAQARFRAALRDERGRWRRWLYRDRAAPKRLRMGWGWTRGRLLEEVPADYLAFLMERVELPREVRDAFAVRLPGSTTPTAR